jgi:hypothetical protein
MLIAKVCPLALTDSPLLPVIIRLWVLRATVPVPVLPEILRLVAIPLNCEPSPLKLPLKDPEKLPVPPDANDAVAAVPADRAVEADVAANAYDELIATDADVAFWA